MAKKEITRLFIERGLLCKITEHEEGALALRAIQFDNLCIRKNDPHFATWFDFSGKELFIPGLKNSSWKQGDIVPYTLHNRYDTLETNATIIRVTEEIVCALPHAEVTHENERIVIDTGGYIDVFTPKKRQEVGKTVEEFLYAIGGEQSALFYEAKYHILSALGVPNAQEEAKKEHMSIREIFQLYSDLAYEEATEQSKKQKRVIIMNPALPHNFTLKKRKNYTP